jgi:hypothetical protein
MAQIAIYLDDETAHSVERAARRDGVSRSAWIRKAVKSQLAGQLPESFFAVLGTWEDSRSPEQILADTRSGLVERDREPLK